MSWGCMHHDPQCFMSCPWCSLDVTATKLATPAFLNAKPTPKHFENIVKNNSICRTKIIVTFPTHLKLDYLLDLVFMYTIILYSI